MAFIVQYISVNGENLVKKESNHSIIILGKSGEIFTKELSGSYRGRLSTCKFAK